MRDDIPAPPPGLSQKQIYVLAIASAVVVANAYYIHPIISLIAEAFEIAPGMIGIVPAFNQIALALGIFCLLPLGDLISNRRLTTLSVALQSLCVFAMALSPGFELFLGASTLLGFVTIAPYLLPAYASKRVAPDQLGYVTAMLTTGIIVGILVARAGAGIVAELFGWRPVYFIAASLMLAVTVALPRIMTPQAESGSDASQDRQGLSWTGYFTLLGSLWPLIGRHKEVLLSGAIQGLGFGTFLLIWMGIGLHLPSPEMGYGVDVVGYLALLAIVSMVTTPRFGRWADQVGPRRARMVFAGVQALAVISFLFVGQNLWLMIVPILLTNMFGPSVDVTGRMTFLALAPEIRTRLMTVYIVLMFLGGGLGSWIGTASYAWDGWYGMTSMASLMALVMWGLCVFGYLRYRD